jgi:diguanylate cyclase (GGDEF)-like protein
LIENQLPFSMLYLVPSMMVTWFGGMRSGIKTSVASSLISLLAYLVTNRFYFGLSASYWASTVKLGFFLIVVPMLWVLKSSLEHQQQFGRTDFLTGVPNRRSFIEAAKSEISRAQRYGHPFTVIYIDLNNFKMINDRFGHATGDKLLRLLAQGIQEKIRETDLLARLGGDEFGILLPQTDSQVAELVVQRLQGVSVPLVQEKGWAMSFSMGVVTFLESPASAEEMLSFADKIVYSAKRDGKTGICRKTFSKSERFTEMSKPVHRNRCNTAQENFQDLSMIGA